MALDRQNPKISGPKTQARTSTRRQKIRRCCLQFHAPPYLATHSHVPHVPSSAMTSSSTTLVWPVLSRQPCLTRTDWQIWPGLNCLPKRKKERKKKKTERENTSTKWTFNLNQKVKIFKTGLSHSIFQVHFDFGTRFFIQNSEIVQTSNFQKSWLLCKCWPNVKIFKMDLSCSIFRVHSNFEVRSVIWDLEIAQMTRFQGSWLLCWSQPKVKIFKPDLSCSIFRDLETTNLTDFSEVLAVSKT